MTLDVLCNRDPFQKPIENDALSAKWSVHIWNRLWKCSSRLYTGTLKTPLLQRSNFRRLKISLKSSDCDLLLEHFQNFSQSHREMCPGIPRPARRPTNSENSVNLVLLDLLDLLSSSRLLEVTTLTFSSDSSRKWQSPWSVTQNLSRRWRRAIWCWRTMLPLFQDVILFRRQQSLTADSFIEQRSGKVQQDRQSFHQRFLHNSDEWHPNSCWLFSFTKWWSLQSMSVPPMLSFIDALLRVQAQRTTFLRQNFH